MSTHSSDTEPITSTLADDPEFAELLVLFVDDLQDRMKQLEKAVPVADHQAIHQLAHAIKGAAGGYGFDIITTVADELDKLAQAEAQADQLVERFDALSNLCSRVKV